MGKVKLILLVVTLSSSIITTGQNIDSANRLRSLSGSITVTNSGISVVPTFTLGKPAALFNFSLSGKKLSFEPELRFSLSGKPWSFLFWWRYKLVRTSRFIVNIGAHPALNFRETAIVANGDTAQLPVARRYLAAEFSPNYVIAKNITVGIYYLASRGIDNGTNRNTHFITVNTNFSNIKLGSALYARLVPQFYYLYIDHHDGFYFTSSLTLGKTNFPLTAQAIINKPLRSDIIGSKNFLWNASLIYSFRRKYFKL